ncbi:MAG: dockerin type I domain-containing protein [Clostridiales bacterium]|nr:dockerin type I domain-containing protein [Clostridiales bacterium]
MDQKRTLLNVHSRQWIVGIMLFIVMAALFLAAPLITAAGKAPASGTKSLATYSFTGSGWATFGIVLPRGEAFEGLQVEGLTTQTDIKNLWPDGSIRYAILTVYIEEAGDYEILESVPAMGTFSPAIPDACLTLNIESDGPGSALVAYRSDLPRTVSSDPWLDGPLVKEWRIRDVPKNSGEEHPFLTNIWDVRIYSDGTGTVDTTVENIRDVAAADAVVYAAEIILNNVPVYHHDATKPGPNPLTSWEGDQFGYTSAANGLINGNYIRLTSGPQAGQIGVVSGVWDNYRISVYPMRFDPPLQYDVGWESVFYHQYGSRWHRVFATADFAKAEVKTDFAPFIEANAIPKYLPTVSSMAESAVNEGAWQNFDVLGFGIMVPSVGMAGGRPEIGLYPEWAARYLAHGTPELKKETLAYGDLAGAFSVHFSKNDTGQIVTIDENPDYWPDRRSNTGNKPLNNLRGSSVRADSEHKTSQAYIPYLVSGGRYYSDEMLFHAHYSLMNIWPYWSGWPRGADGMMWGLAHRGYAWCFRDVADAAYYLPDDSEYKDFFMRIVKANLQNLDTYAAELNSPLGFVEFGAVFPDTGRNIGYAQSGLWQNTYFAWSLDHAISQNDTDAGVEMLKETLRSVLGALTNGPAFLPEYAGYPYLDIGTHQNKQIEMFKTWGEVFEATFRNPDNTLIAPHSWVGYYGPELRIASILGKKYGLPGATGAYDFVMTMEDGRPGSFMRSLNERSAFAIADQKAAKPEMDAEPVEIRINDVLYSPDDIPPEIPAGQVFWFEALIKNTGTEPWIDDGAIDHHPATLLSRAPDYNSTFGAFLVTPFRGYSVQPGGIHSFHSSLMAPSTPGTYTVKWQLADWAPLSIVRYWDWTAAPFFGPEISLTVKVVPRIDSPPSTPPRQPGVVDEFDLEYCGSFVLPRLPGANDDVATYRQSGIALRDADGEQRLILTAGTYDQTLYEVAIPAFGKIAGSDTSAVPQAELRTVFGELPKVSGEYTNGTMWYDRDAELLYWTNNHSYYTPTSAGITFPTLRSASLAGGAITEKNQWLQPLDLGDAPDKSFWGGVTNIPEGFAAAYTGGKTLGMGFGGAYSNGANAYSYGPSLAAVSLPSTGGTMDMQPVFYYPRSNPATRDGNYFRSAGPEGNPASPWEGTWTSGDTTGSGVFIDLPDKKGYISFERQAIGRIGYDYGGINWHGQYQNVWKFYDYETLGKAASGATGKEGLVPSSVTYPDLPNDATSANQQIAGSVFDPDSRLLYVYSLKSVSRSGYYNPLQPAVHVYRVKEDTAFVSGKIKSYNPTDPTTIQLMKGKNIIYTATISKTENSGQVEQEFTFAKVAPDNYDLVINKAAHTKFTVQNLIVGAEGLDLTENSCPEVQLMTLRCGDINSDGLINDADLTILWREGNYNRKAIEAENSLCDLNGDGLINDADLTILWLTYNYNRGAIVID